MIEDMKKLNNKLKDAIQYPGLILAIKISDFTDQLKKWLIKIPIKKSLYEIPIYFLIEPDKLYIIPEDIKDKNVIQLMSDEGKTYVNDKLDKLDKLKIGLEWTQDKVLTGKIKYNLLRNNEYYIQIRYDAVFKNILLYVFYFNELIIDLEWTQYKYELKKLYKEKITNELKDKINITIIEIIYNTGKNRDEYYTIFKEFQKKYELN